MCVLHLQPIGETILPMPCFFMWWYVKGAHFPIFLLVSVKPNIYVLSWVERSGSINQYERSLKVSWVIGSWKGM